MPTPLIRTLEFMAEVATYRQIAIELALALADEVAFHGEDNCAEASLSVLSRAREVLDLGSEFDAIDSLKMEP